MDQFLSPPSEIDPRFEPIPATEAQLRELTALIRDESGADRGRRLERRHPIGPRVIPMTAIVLRGSKIKRCVGAYDLSSGGLAALVRGAPPVGSRLRLGLFDKEGALREIDAQVRWVREVAERYQAMGVRFARAIDLKLFI